MSIKLRFFVALGAAAGCAIAQAAPINQVAYASRVQSEVRLSLG